MGQNSLRDRAANMFSWGTEKLPRESRSPFRPGDTVDNRYLIDGYIARGGMSVVYRAIDTRLDRPVALKVLRPDLALQPHYRERFVAEAKTAASLHGPGIVDVTDQGMWHDAAFLVMELVAGGTVRELLQERGPMPPYAAVAVMRQCLAALAIAHASGFVHRDIKPENLLIGTDSSVKVADFGLVQAVQSEPENSSAESSLRAGTAAYLAPEQVTDGPIDAHCDVYAAGLVLYELLVGEPPFGRESTREVALRRLTEDVPLVSEERSSIPPVFDEIIQRATQHDPAHRYADAQDMELALAKAALDLSLPEYDVPVPRQSAEQTSAASALSTTGALPSNFRNMAVDGEAVTEIVRKGTSETAVLSAETNEQLADIIETDESAAVPPMEKDSPRRGKRISAVLQREGIAEKPRVWPAIIWMLVSLLLLIGVGYAFYALGMSFVAMPGYEDHTALVESASVWSAALL